MLFNSIQTFKDYMKEYPTHPVKERKLKTNILHTVGVKIHHSNFSNNLVMDLNENIGDPWIWRKNDLERQIYIHLFTPIFKHRKS